MSRVPLTVLALALAAGLSACGDDAPTPAGTTAPADVPSPATTGADAERPVIELTVHDGEVSGADTRTSVPLGSEVTISVTSDVDDVIHLHGYDVHQDVTAGSTTALTFTADIPGVFEVELEDAGLRLIEVEVR